MCIFKPIVIESCAKCGCQPEFRFDEYASQEALRCVSKECIFGFIAMGWTYNEARRKWNKQMKKLKGNIKE